MPVHRLWDPRLLCACVLAAAAPLRAQTGLASPENPALWQAEILGLLLGPCALALTLARLRRLAARAAQPPSAGRRR